MLYLNETYDERFKVNEVNPIEENDDIFDSNYLNVFLKEGHNHVISNGTGHRARCGGLAFECTTCCAEAGFLMIVEKAPMNPAAEEWIVANKDRFKKRYGRKWKQVLYAKAWKLYGKNAHKAEKRAEAGE